MTETWLDMDEGEAASRARCKALREEKQASEMKVRRIECRLGGTARRGRCDL